MAALAITAPAGSETVPVMVPRSLCANASKVSPKRQASNERSLIAPPLVTAEQIYYRVRTLSRPTLAKRNSRQNGAPAIVSGQPREEELMRKVWVGGVGENGPLLRVTLAGVK